MYKKYGRIRRPAEMALAGLLLTLTLANPFTVSGLQRLHNPIQLTSPSPQRLGHFGFSVATDGRDVVVGAFGETGGQPSSGRAYVFDTRTGKLLFSLSSPNPDLGGWFGWSVAIDSGLIVVGAPYETIPGFPPFAGRAYVFDATTGSLIVTLSNPDPSASWAGFGVNLGFSVSVGGGRIVVGTFAEGQAFVFSTATKNLMFTLGRPFAVESFGRRVAVGGGLVVVGSDFHGVYAFNATDSDLVYTLSSPNQQLFGEFGSSVAVGNGLVIVGADLEDAHGIMMAGNAYAFNATTGRLLFTLANSNPQRLGYFGVSVAVDESMIFVGSFGEAGGNVYVYNANTGRLMFALSSPNSETGGTFGRSVSAATAGVVVGADGETITGQEISGNAYVF